MDEKTPLQRHMEIMLRELGMNPEQFANAIVEKTGKPFSTTNVYNYMNGTTGVMQQNKAKQINKVFPQFPVDWLRGFSEARTESEKLAETMKPIMTAQKRVNESVASILSHGGYSSFFDYQSDDENGFEYYAITRNSDGETLNLPVDRWSDFVDEVCAYVKMRFDLAFERGAW